MPFHFIFKKHIEGQLFPVIFLTIIISGCKKETNPTPSGSTPNFVGQTFEGGIVGYIFQKGDYGFVAGESHGLIVAAKELDSMVTWGCMDTLILTASDTTFGSGQRNTEAIIRICNTPDIAAKYCDQLDLHGYDDWYLPSKMELEKLYKNSVYIGGFNYMGAYWSSSQSDADKASMFDFRNFEFVTSDKSTPARVRAVRSF